MTVNIRVYAVAAIVVVFIFAVAISYISVNSVYAADYERSQTIVQTNECGNYWFPLNVLCSNLGSQTNGDENTLSVASAQQQEGDKSSKSSGPPFP